MVLEQFIIDADIIWDQVGKTFFENPEAKPGRIMRVQVVNAGIVEDLTGYTLNLGWTSVRDPSKFGLDAFDAVDITKGIFEIEYTSGMLTNIGPLNASLQLVPPGQGRPIESNNFKLMVKNSAINPEAIQGETSFSTLENALVEVNGWNARIDVVEQEFKDRADALDEAYPVRLTAAEQSVAQKVGGGVKAEPEDLSATTLGLVTGTGGPINLLSIPQDKSVTPIKTNFMRDSINLYKGLINDLAVNTSGTNFPQTGSYASSNVPITGVLYALEIQTIAFYTAENVFINTTGNGNVPVLTAINIPVNAAIFRYSVHSTDVSKAFIALSATEITEAEYNYKIESKYLDVNQLLKNQYFVDLENGDKFKTSAIKPESVSFFRDSLNMYDNISVNNLAVNNTGTLYPLAGAYASSREPITATKLFALGVSNIAFFNSENVFISVTGNGGASTLTPITIPATATNIMYSVLSAKIPTAFIAFSDDILSVPEYNSKLKPEFVDIYSILSSEDFSENVSQKVIDTVNAIVIDDVYCYGDSLTEGAGSTNAGVYGYPARLNGLVASKNTGYVISNYGVGGQSSSQIAIRQGAYEDVVQPFTIPSDTIPVAITKSTNTSALIGGQTTIKNGVNPVTIAGVEGTLSYDNGFYFTRSVAGAETVVTRPTLLRYKSSKNKNGILLLCIGTNGGYADLDDLVRQNKLMIANNNCDKYMVICPPINNAAMQAAWETKMSLEFGSKCFNMRKYLVDYGLSDNSLTATTQDNADIAEGRVPTQLRNDGTHMNNYGYYSWAVGIYKYGQDLGYWL